MDLQMLIAQWSGSPPTGFVGPAILDTGLATCCHKRCRNKVAIKRDGTPAHACQPCLDRRAPSCKRRRLALVDYASHYTSTVPFVARLDVGGRRLAYGTPGRLVGRGSGISYRR